jgi:hypothetical protein
MPSVGFENTVPVFERAKTVHALDRGAILIGAIPSNPCKFVIIHILQECVDLYIHSPQRLRGVVLN